MEIITKLYKYGCWGSALVLLIMAFAVTFDVLCRFEARLRNII